MKDWDIHEPDETLVKQLAQQTGLALLPLRILVSRGYRTKDEIETFLSGGRQLTDPMALRDMDKAVERVRQALGQEERIAVYGDYDCDGIMATSMMYRYFEALGADICYYIPQRDREGYGMNREALHRIYEDGVRLVITVDNGITALEEVAYANSIGLDIVITDHHKPRDVLPQAAAVVDPHRADDESGCEYLCGTGVAFKLICALENESDWMLDQYGDLLAVATVADIVPLVGENREFVARGLGILQNTDNDGLAALLAACGLSEKALSSETVTFGLVPRINSAGRFDHVDSAIELFVSEGGDMSALAQEINQLNDQRRKTEDKIITQIFASLELDQESLQHRIIVIYGEDWHHGVVGIVASRLVERFGKPCIVLSVEGDEVRGSGRSVEGFSIIDAINACSSYLIRFGGHNQAAGVTLSKDQLKGFIQAINAWAAEHYPEMPRPRLALDCPISPGQLQVAELQSLSCLEPFGCGNDTPVFYIHECALQGIYPIGEGRHLRLRFGRDSTVFYALYFGMTPQSIPFEVGDTLDLAVTADVGEWNGEMRVSVKIRDARVSNIDYTALYRSNQRYDSLTAGGNADTECVPSRADIAVVYRFLRIKKECVLSPEHIYIRLAKQISSLCKTKIALDVLEEMGLIRRANSGGTVRIVVRENPPKVDLSDSKILQRLRRCETEPVASRS